LQSQKLLPTLPVTAPIDGTLVGFDKFLGHVVRPEEPIFEIHDLSQAWVQGFISERDLPMIRVGQPARCRLVTAPDEVIPGTIVRSGQQLTDNDRTLSVWIKLDAMPSFPVQHNMLARITIDSGVAYRGLAIPREAVVHEGTRHYVFVRKADQTFERRLISIGPADDNAIAVLNGLSAGDLIAVQGAVELQSGYAALK
jgi:cobalt-zinc-cadmium efflux system membrane fusion protein